MIDSQASYQLLQGLYERQLQARPDDAYLKDHSRSKTMANQVSVFEFYATYLPPIGRVLDWGCRHAPDACLMRAQFGAELRIHGCDFVEPGAYSVFHDFARLEYTKLDHIVKLPYEDESIDAVIGSGALEHCAMDYESLKEIYRILKVDGRFIISYLPNRLSVAEWWNRRRDPRTGGCTASMKASGC